MPDQEFANLLDERMKEIARAVFERLAGSYTSQLHPSGEPSAKLHWQLGLIKAKEHITVKEAALLLSCSESHIRKLVMLARKGKTRRPVPFVDLEGVTVFPLVALLNWASQKPQLQAIKNEAA
jgi:hypothetical protein